MGQLGFEDWCTWVPILMLLPLAVCPWAAHFTTLELWSQEMGLHIFNERRFLAVLAFGDFEFNSVDSCF